MKSSLVGLKCSQCQGKLVGENNSVVFFCFNCHLGMDVGGKSINNYPLKYIKPIKDKNIKQIYFPFWQILCDYQIDFKESDPLDIKNRPFYVPGFFIKNINYFGDLGLYYTSKSLVFEENTKKNCPVFPADRHLGAAIVYPKIYLYQELDKKIPKPEINNIDITYRQAEILLIPFYKTETEYIDSIILWKYPSGALI